MIDAGLAGKRAIVAGGASGIGQAIALALKGEAAAVAVVDRVSADVTVELGDEEASVRAVEEACAMLGGLDLLVYSAAIARHEPVVRLAHVPGAHLQAIFQLPVGQEQVAGHEVGAVLGVLEAEEIQDL